MGVIQLEHDRDCVVLILLDERFEPREWPTPENR
jgi:hypothetical protein